MVLKKGFINKKEFSIHLSKRKMFIGGLLGFVYSVVFYAFIKLISKSLVVFDAILHNYELIILPKSKQDFYSFLIAFIAVNFSFSIIFSFFIDIPKSFLGKYDYKRKNILNLQRVTNWFFLNWFCRMAFMFGILALSFESDNFFSNLIYLFYLIIIVFLGQMWMSIRPFLNKNKIKTFLIFISSTLLLTFAISIIEVIDNEIVNNYILSKNKLYKYNIDRVTSNSHQNLPQYQRRFFDIYLKESKGKLLTKTEISNYYLESKSLSNHISYFKNSLSEYEKPFIGYVLLIDKDVKMKYVKNTLKTLKQNEAKRVYYSTKDKELPFYVKSTNALGFILNNNNPEEIKLESIKIKILDKGKFYFQNDTLSKDLLRKSLLKKIQINGILPFVISYNENTSFERYFEVLSLTKSIIDKFRDEYTQKGYNQNYSTLPRSIKKTIKQELYWVFIDNME